LKILLICLTFLFYLNAIAETSVFKETDNTGLNKKERIDGIEKYLSDLSASIKNLENKFEENTKKLKSIEDVINKLNISSNKKLGEEISDHDSNPELSKLKKEIEGIKSKEIEKLKLDITGLNESIKSIEKVLKIQNR
jgi:peptidoglycan hydrolase CwlO-like protein